MILNSLYRAGRYEKQKEGYSAFIPACLPPVPPIDYSSDLPVALARAAGALGNLNGSIQTFPPPELFVSMYIRREAVLSSKIEGTQSSLQDLLAAEAQIFANDYHDDVYDVIDYVAAMKHGLEKVKSLPVSTPIIRAIHKKLLQNTRGSHLTPGELRIKQNWIGPSECTVHDAVFVPPPPSQVAHHMEELDGFIESNEDLPLLVKIGLVHAQFETIHPFRDGNGRVGRLIVTLMLCQSKVLEQPLLYISSFFNRHRQEYYDRLQSVRDEGRWEDWLLFFLRAVEEVSNHATITARKILEMREENRVLINAQFGRTVAYAHRVLDYLYGFPIVNVKMVQELIGTKYAPANALVARMVDCGLLQEITGWARNRHYRLQKYVEIFN